MRAIVRLGILVLVAVAVVPACDAAPKPAALALPPATALMRWTRAQRIVGFRNMARIFPSGHVARGPRVHPLPVAARPLVVRYTQNGGPMDAAGFMAANNMAGLLVLHDGKIVLERYRLGLTRTGRWTSFSVAKSVTSTLVGAAIRDGAIKSLDDPVTRYVHQLHGSAYDAVSVRQLLMMSSGVRWNEDYEDPNSDIAHLFDADPITPLKDRPREFPAGTHFHYSTADADLIGLMVMQATGKSLSQYLSEKIWAPYGMEQDATWMKIHGQETGGANISMTLRDYARFGEFIRGGGLIDGKPVLADGWVADATKRHIDSDWGKIGYGYQWWINPDGTFRALGIYGQLIYIDPAHKLVIAGVSAWPYPDRDETYAREDAFIAAVEKAIGAH